MDDRLTQRRKVAKQVCKWQVAGGLRNVTCRLLPATCYLPPATCIPDSLGALASWREINFQSNQPQSFDTTGGQELLPRGNNLLPQLLHVPIVVDDHIGFAHFVGLGTLGCHPS